MVLNFGDKLEEEDSNIDMKWLPPGNQANSGNSTPHGH